MSERIRFAIVGTGQRSNYLYGPLLTTLSDDVELVGVWGRSEGKAKALGEKFHVPWFTDLERLRDEARPEAAAVAVAYAANGEVGRRVVEELVADTTPQVVWRNPFRAYYMDDEMIAVADCVMSLLRAIRRNRRPEYGAEQARLDQEVILAMYESARQRGEPVKLPLV